MAKYFSTNVFRVIVSHYTHHILNTGQKTNLLNHVHQRCFIDFTSVVSRLKQKLNDVIQNSQQINVKESQNLRTVVSIDNQIALMKKPHLVHSSIIVNVAPHLNENDVNILMKKSLPKQNKIISVEKELENQTISNIIQMYPKLREVPLKDVTENYKALLKIGIEENLIKEHINLLANDCEDLHTKIVLISQCGFDAKDGILFANMDINQLQLFVRTCDKEVIKPVDKVKALCDLSQESIHNMCLHFYKCKYLRNENLYSVKEKIKLFLDAGFTFGDIIKDCQVLSYKKETIKLKLNLIQENKIQVNKISILRKSTKALKTVSVDKQEVTNLNTEESLITNYIAARMKCKEEDIMCIFFKNPKLKSMKLQKIKEVCDLFDDFGIDLNKLIHWPQLFSKKTDSIRSRLIKMQKKNCDISSNMLYLTKTSKEFETLMKKLYH